MVTRVALAMAALLPIGCGARTGMLAADGDDSVPAGCHALRLIAADSGFFRAGQGFRVFFVRPGGELFSTEPVEY